jgi:hypothetical protein
MATDNKGVMVYLPPDLEEVLEKYCTENNITRKNRDGEPVPSMGTGIVQYLKSHLLGISLGNVSSLGLTRDEVLELIKDSGTSNVSGDGLSIDRVTEIARSEVELVTAPMFDDLLNLQSQLAEVKNDCDLTTEGIQRLIDEAISKMSAGNTNKPQQAAKKTASPASPDKEVLKMVRRLENSPELMQAVTSGIDQGLKGKEFCDYLFSQGQGSTGNTKPFDVSVAGRIKRAIEYLNASDSAAR